ncbi:hypothetical protein F5Y08DRAFT_285898 [Xylaria arbuscula]|nr:hypothetical protein F5Y08DRAFT_285898 [Xylaria arbuscula]
MYRAALRSAPRTIGPLRQSSSRTTAASGRRFASTAPADKRRSWKSSAVRWGLAVGVVYWYSTSAVFAEEPRLTTVQPPPEFSDEDLPTIEAVVAQKRKEAEARSRKAAVGAPKSKTSPEPETAALASQTSPEAPAKELDVGGSPIPEGTTGGPEALEEEAAQQGAFNPETGEINWDCPCLGGMAHGPCGEEFKAAFSCFVYSEEEPKGMDCIDKFQHMQDCFRLHPEVYGEELADDDQAAPADGEAPEGVMARDASAEGASAIGTTTPTESAAEPAASVRATDATEANAKIGESKPAADKTTPAPSPSKSATKAAAPKSTKPE